MLPLALAAFLGQQLVAPPAVPGVTAVRMPALFSMPFQYRQCSCGRAECPVILCMRCCREIHLCTCKARA